MGGIDGTIVRTFALYLHTHSSAGPLMQGSIPARWS